MEKMSIHRALSDLKLYDAKINKATREGRFIEEHKLSDSKIKGKTIEELKNEIQGSMDKVTALIENKKRIKSAIVLSNATTTIVIGDKTYTVAEAIERKNMIGLEYTLLNSLRLQYNQALLSVETENNRLSDRFEKYLQNVLGDKDKRNVDDIEAHRKTFYGREEHELIDPLKLSDIIEKMTEDLETFSKEIDYKLSESNATTFIEVDLTTVK